ncbi:MAG: hypothetical protein K8R08_09065, partial [Methanosarcinales archaeon]|nr:hypothetical protein [Methanosarcinales archaeon]
MVEFTVIVGSIGVSLLLLAFFLNLFKILMQDNKIYVIMNILGAGLVSSQPYNVVKYISYVPY